MSDVPASLAAALADRYTLERQLGQGGMATVYLAHDVKHDRKVALKVLKPELAAVLGADRFVVEIRTTAQLQHPHILPLFDSGTADGFLYYVMPFIDGETLRAKLDRETQLGIDEAVRIAVAIADALDYAHRHGVIHRDIKPENILLHDGRPMVADFGIALAVSAAAGGRMTETGLSLGTPHYMSPEQATAAKEISARADIYSLASVLYEMLTGEPPHTGASAQQIIMKIVTEEAAPVTKLRKAVPPHVADAVARALEKLPADRFASAKEFADALGNPTYALPGTRAVRAPAAGPPARSARLRAAAPWAIAALSLVAAGWASWPAVPDTAPVVMRFAYSPADSLAFLDGFGGTIAASPKGDAIAYQSRAGIVLRATAELQPRVIPGTRGAIQPFFSPDGEWLAFVQDAAIHKVAAGGDGVRVTICDSCPGYGYDWGQDDTIRYHGAPIANPRTRELRQVPARGGTWRAFATPDSGSTELFRSPQLLPDGRRVLFNIFAGATGRVAVLDLDSHEITRLDLVGTQPRYVHPGYVMVGNPNGSVVAYAFDVRRLRVTGPAVVVANDVLSGDFTGIKATVSRNGLLAYPQAGVFAPRRLTMVSRNGLATAVPMEARAYGDPRFSPDGRRVALTITAAGGESDIWILDLAERSLARLTTQRIANVPLWSRDGGTILYSQNADLWRIPADGSGAPDSLLVAAGARYFGGVTPDGRTGVFYETGSADNGIRVIALDSTHTARTIFPSAFAEGAPVLSPDGRWLAYQSDEAGRTEVYVRRLDGSGARVLVSVNGGAVPAWSASGRELFYRGPDSMVVATVATTPTFAVTARRSLFPVAGYIAGDASSRGYDVSPDGSRFLMMQGTTSGSPVVVLHGFFDRLAWEARQRR